MLYNLQRNIRPDAHLPVLAQHHLASLCEAGYGEGFEACDTDGRGLLVWDFVQMVEESYVWGGRREESMRWRG